MSSEIEPKLHAETTLQVVSSDLSKDMDTVGTVVDANESYTPEEEKAVLRKIDLMILPAVRLAPPSSISLADLSPSFVASSSCNTWTSKA